MPDVPPPDDCPPRPIRMPVDGTITERLDMRLRRGRDCQDLDGDPATAGSQMWARIPEMIE